MIICSLNRRDVVHENQIEYTSLVAQLWRVMHIRLGQDGAVAAATSLRRYDKPAVTDLEWVWPHYIERLLPF
jgi:hypothetical protein